MNKMKHLIIMLLCLWGVGTAHPQDFPLLDAIIQVESGGDPNPPDGDNGEAVGILQIHKIFVDDVNQILGEAKYTYDDRRDPVASVEMFCTYHNYWCGKHNDWTLEGLARRHNGGPWGHKKESTIPYWEKVKKVLYNE